MQQLFCEFCGQTDIDENGICRNCGDKAVRMNESIIGVKLIPPDWGVLTFKFENCDKKNRKNYLNQFRNIWSQIEKFFFETLIPSQLDQLIDGSKEQIEILCHSDAIFKLKNLLTELGLSTKPVEFRIINDEELEYRISALRIAGNK